MQPVMDFSKSNRGIKKAPHFFREKSEGLSGIIFTFP
jgi:hypothetical protein